MEIEVKVATILLKKAEPELASTSFSMDIPEGADVEWLIDALGLPRKLVGSVTINKKRSPTDTVISESDLVAIIPAISGG
jgi:molybdopterin converting factor small subunit